MSAAARRQIPFRSACCLAQTWANWHLCQAEAGLSMASLGHLFRFIFSFPVSSSSWSSWAFVDSGGYSCILLCIFVSSPKDFLYRLSSSLQMPVSEWGVGSGEALLIHTPIAKGSLMCSTSVHNGMDKASLRTSTLMWRKGHWEILWGGVQLPLWCRVQKMLYDCAMKIWGLSYDWGCRGQQLKACIHSVPKWLPSSLVKIWL